MGVSERRACRVAGQHRSTQRRAAPPNPYRDRLVARMRDLAVENPRRGRRYVMDLLHKEGWSIGTRRMKRLWRAEGLLVPGTRVKRRRIGHGLHGIARRRATMKNDVWGMDFVQDRTADGGRGTEIGFAISVSGVGQAGRTGRGGGGADLGGTPERDIGTTLPGSGHLRRPAGRGRRAGRGGLESGA